MRIAIIGGGKLGTQRGLGRDIAFALLRGGETP
jgi:hypothetical protein